MRRRHHSRAGGETWRGNDQYRRCRGLVPLLNGQTNLFLALLGRIVNVGRLGGMTGEFNFDLHALKAHRLYRRYLPHPLA
jgi:hypothetical protein